ncbi:hypothetical protein DSECCO2_361480 [anaerobic digester metagenome]
MAAGDLHRPSEHTPATPPTGSTPAGSTQPDAAIRWGNNGAGTFTGMSSKAKGGRGGYDVAAGADNDHKKVVVLSIDKAKFAMDVQIKTAPDTKITTTLDFTKTSAEGGMSDKATCVDGSDHTHPNGNYCWAWDNATTTLTLDGVDVETTDTVGIKLPAGNELILKGNNQVVSTGKAGFIGQAISSDGAMTISDSGHLTATGKRYGLACDGLNIENGTVSSTGQERGIFSLYDVIISGSKVTATGAGAAAYGITATNNITISGANTEVTATGASCTYVAGTEISPSTKITTTLDLSNLTSMTGNVLYCTNNNVGSVIPGMTPHTHAPTPTAGRGLRTTIDSTCTTWT